MTNRLEVTWLVNGGVRSQIVVLTTSSCPPDQLSCELKNLYLPGEDKMRVGIAPVKTAFTVQMGGTRRCGWLMRMRGLFRGTGQCQESELGHLQMGGAAVGPTPDAEEQVTRKAWPAESCSAAPELTGLFQARLKW